MFYNVIMNELSKLKALSPYAVYELDGEAGLSAQPACRRNPREQPGETTELPVTMVTLPGGKRIPMLKSMLTSVCEKNCYYCAFRSGRDFRRQSFHPEELAKTSLLLFERGVAEGIFLSSGVVGGGVKTQDRLLAAADILRNKLGYIGYLHLKIMPGAEPEQVLRAMQLADRVSVNLEAPNTQRLSELCPEKTMLDQLVAPLKWVEQYRQTQPCQMGWNGRWPSSTTQFVVGGGKETDQELLYSSQYLLRTMRLARVYFSGFSPIRNTPFEDRAAVDPWRQNRLYQASFLLRDYGFDYDELTFDQQGNLPLELDPKQAWADVHLRHVPVEVNRASYPELLRIPGIGPRSANQIVAQRLRAPLCSVDDLKRLGICIQRVAPYVLVNGRRLPVQQALF